MKERQCKRCLEIKDISLFPIDIVNWKEYIRYKCKHCRTEERRLKSNYKELKLKAYKRYYNKNKDDILKRASIYKKTDYWKIAVLNSNTKRQRIIDNTYDWSININSLNDILIKQNYQCNICKCDLNKNIKHIDHIKPLSKWWQHTILNIQYLCKKCNLVKSNKYEY